MKSYDYENRAGIRWVSWEDFAEMSARLTEELSAIGVDAIVGIARAGLFPATAVACALRCELYPVRVTRRYNDEVVHTKPQWMVPVSDDVAGKVIAVVDEIADSGETLAIVSSQVLIKGATRVVTATLVHHSHAKPLPTVSVVESDQFVVFPWDQRVYVDQQWQAHPEVLAGLSAQQGRSHVGALGDD